jgi:hypothetical protein
MRGAISPLQNTPLWRCAQLKHRDNFTCTFYPSRSAVGPTQPPIQWVPGALSLGVKRPGREADHLSPSSVEVKNAWSHTSTSQYAFMAWCSVKARGQVYLFTCSVIQLCDVKNWKLKEGEVLFLFLCRYFLVTTQE